METIEKQLEERPRALKIAGTIGFLLLAAGTTIFFLHEYLEGHFKDVNSLSEYIEAYGILGPVMLTFFQCVKVLVAIVPGAIGCIAGASMFGALGGFLCSY
ncbi:MAG: TVP38/TMEM64 family protein, partial [Treponema sp.]|nr:TVP38/TMEM64 family protein [Treponema sp.]